MITHHQQLTFSPDIYSLMGISRKTIEEHVKLYQGYVSKYNTIQDELASLTQQQKTSANQVYSLIRSLKTELSFAWGGIVNHELYFNNLNINRGTTSSTLLGQIDRDFGSMEQFREDLKATGMAARGWVWTVYNPSEKRLYNHLGDAQNTYALWGCVPILALDVYEHAYFLDFGTARSSYIDAFWNHIDWAVVSERFENTVKANS